MINFILWKWKQTNFREEYTAEHVNIMVDMLARHCKVPHQVVCITDDPAELNCRTHPIWNDHSKMMNISGPHLPSCYRRLKIFDVATTDAIGIPRGERVVSLDLDALIVSERFGSLFDRPERFVGWQVPGHRHLKVFNGSMFLFRAGDLQFLWDTFDPKRSPSAAIKQGYMGSDQGWLSQQLVNRSDVGGWTARDHGVRSYLRDVRVPRVFSEKATCIVFFAGRRKPWHSDVQHESPWISRYVQYPTIKDMSPCNSLTRSRSTAKPVSGLRPTAI